MLEVALYAVSFVFLGYASWRDLKTREVSNKVWLFYAPVILLFAVVDLWVFRPYWIMAYVVSAGVVCVVSLGLWSLRVWGGADAKAMLCVGMGFVVALLALANCLILRLGMELGNRRRREIPMLPLILLGLLFTVPFAV